jgi:uncharacterized protein YjbI with pentapeptide repeats
MVQRVDGQPSAPTDETIRGQDWYATDISDLVHERILFQDADLDEATGRGARFVDCTFRSASLVGAKLEACAFENCTFIRGSLLNATLTECKLVGSRFDAMAFDQLQVVGGDWSFVGLPGADLRRASFTGARMREADLTGAQLRGATLSGCDLSSAMWSRADVSKCDLRGSEVSSLDPFEVRIAGAIIDWEQAIALARNLGLDVRAD